MPVRDVATAELLESEVAFDAAERPDVLILACGAIAREVLAVIRLNGWTHVDVRCLPASSTRLRRRSPAPSTPS